MDFQKRRCFPESQKSLVCKLSLGGQNVSISMVLGRFMKMHVSRRGVFNEFHSRFRWKIICIGGAQDLKTVEILKRN